MKRRRIDVVVISDVHLGTYNCKADALITYLNSIQPSKLILNGNIINSNHLDNKYFPATHLKLIRKILRMAEKGTEVFYITDNRDEMLRKFDGSTLGNLHFTNKLILTLDDKKVWFFNGNIFDSSISYTKWLVKLGRYSCNFLIFLHRCFTWLSKKTGHKKSFLSKKITTRTKAVIEYIQNFEKSIIDIAIEHGYDYVVCGHTHQPKKEIITTAKGRATYLNSGDWIENLTALEYVFKRWKIYQYKQDKLLPFYADDELMELDMNELVSSITALKEHKEKEGEASFE